MLDTANSRSNIVFTMFTTDSELRELLRKRLKGKTMSSIAKEMGVKLNFLSMVVNGAPITGKILAGLGYERVRERLYRPLGKNKAARKEAGLKW